MAAARLWLAAVLLGDSTLPTALTDNVEVLFAAAEDEGVTALVSQKLAATPGGPLQEAFASRARALAAGALFRNAEYVRVFELLGAAEISPLLLKGSSLGFWLYPSPYLRETADFDLLFESAEQARQAATILRTHGYVGGSYFGSEAHEVTLRRNLAPTLSVDLDLHWRLFSFPAFLDVLPTRKLFLGALPIPGFHENARGLHPAHAMVHACLHRAMNLHMGIGDRLKWLYDLHLLADRLSEDEWDSVLGVCAAHRVNAVCLDAFRATTQAFGTEFPQRVLENMSRLAVGEGIDPRQLGNWRYMQWRAVSSIPTISGRVRWLFLKIFPPLDYLKSFYGPDMTWRQLLVERVRRLRTRMR